MLKRRKAGQRDTSERSQESGTHGTEGCMSGKRVGSDGGLEVMGATLGGESGAGAEGERRRKREGFPLHKDTEKNT